MDASRLAEFSNRKFGLQLLRVALYDSAIERWPAAHVHNNNRLPQRDDRRETERENERVRDKQTDRQRPSERWKRAHEWIN